MNNAIQVLIVDDSALARVHLVQVLETDPRIRVMGTVADGQAALDFLQRNQPDVILMDINMPGLDGFETTRRIMETRPVPIVICSSSNNPKDATTTFRVLEAGAVACVEKPYGREHADFARMAAELRLTVRLMSEVRVVKRRTRNGSAAALPAPHSAPGVRPGRETLRWVGLGASTGGPPVLQAILGGLPPDFPVPLLLVQHLAQGFLPGLVEWLNQTTRLEVHIAAHGTMPLPGHAYFAPDDHQMGLGVDGRLVLTKDAPEEHLRPAVAFLFRSLARVAGPGAVGVLLTGMGRDGAAELRLMHDRGAVTIAQDRASSIVHGMPGEAIALGGATHILPADCIAGALLTLAGQREVAS